MEILKMLGIILFMSGVLLAIYTFVSAKKNNMFNAVRELRLIRESGYVKEHEEKRVEDVYRKEPMAQQSRLISRRAKKVLEKMDKQEIKQDFAARLGEGTSVVEEVRHRLSSPISLSNPEDKPINEEGTAVLSRRAAYDEHTEPLLRKGSSLEGTATLPERRQLPEETERLRLSQSEESTALLQRREEDGPFEGTGVLLGKSHEMSSRRKDNALNTDILKRTKDSGEGTAYLAARTESDGSYRIPSSIAAFDTDSGTDILSKPCDEEGTEALVHREEGTEVLERRT